MCSSRIWSLLGFSAADAVRIERTRSFSEALGYPYARRHLLMKQVRTTVEF